MRWIKLFEDFNSDVLEDVKDILRLHLGELEEVNFIGGDLQIQMSDSLRNRIKVYRLLESTNVKDLTSFEEHIKDEKIDGFCWNVNLNDRLVILCICDSIESFLGEWLIERFPKPEMYIREAGRDLQVFYRDTNGGAIFYYYDNDRQDKNCHVSFNKIWGFFNVILGLEDYQIIKIIKTWLKNQFNLDLEPKMW